MSSFGPNGLELWGGLECSLVRIGDRWRYQLDELGQALDRTQLQRIAELGIRRLRFPVLWETVAPQRIDQCDWRWHDVRLAELQAVGIKPIAGLIHHGSGPRYTHLLDPQFPALFARYAQAVARRYPWIDAYTPINEPLTTARFSALYGHWYPHARDLASCLRALVVQCRATVLAMRAIRRINPAAQFIHTEDLGKVYAPPALQYQADHENERRWLSHDLLMGRVDAGHSFRRMLREAGIRDADLDELLQHDVAPDILGINHYLTSERYLDPDLRAYPPSTHGGNAFQAYADVEAVRMPQCADDVGPQARLLEIWQRYRRPVAVTEAHHGCTRDEQVRWLMEVWNAARSAREQGADVRAVTLWSLMGTMDWNTLLVQQNKFYEPGPFDARSTPMRSTLLARAATGLSTAGRFDHPIMDEPGWWRRSDRFYRPAAMAPAPGPALRRAPRRLLVTGHTGTLGRAFARVCARRGLPFVLLSRGEMDIADARSVRAALSLYQPWAVINGAGYVQVATAERESDRCLRENLHGPETLAAACAERNLPLVTFSSDLVFDGQLGRAYVESDPTTPQGTYGFSKAEAERQVLAAWPRTLVVRTSAFFGPWDRYNFMHNVIARLRAGVSLEAAQNVVVSPTYVPDLAHATLDLLLDDEAGVWHLANRGALSWYELARWTAEEMALRTELITPRAHPRSTSTALETERGWIMPPLEGALARFVRDCAVGGML